MPGTQEQGKITDDRLQAIAGADGWVTSSRPETDIAGALNHSRLQTLLIV